MQTRLETPDLTAGKNCQGNGKHHLNKQEQDHAAGVKCCSGSVGSGSKVPPGVSNMKATGDIAERGPLSSSLASQELRWCGCHTAEAL